MDELKDRLASLSPEKRALLAHKLSQRRRGARGEESLPPVAAAPDQRFEPFPLTGLQQAYWMGRSDAFELGNLASRAYLEIDCPDLDRSRLCDAWDRLVERHEMLRVVVHDDGTQRILERTPPYEIAGLDLRAAAPEAAPAQLLRVRQEMLEARESPEKWPLFELRTSALPGGRSRLHATFDLLNVDAASISLLFRELQALYERPGESLPELTLSFRDYWLHEQALRATPAFARAREYWLERVPELPPAPALPLAQSPSAIRAPRFTRCLRELSPELTRTLKARAREIGTSHTGLLLAAYAEILARWCASPRFTLNIPLLNRLPVHPQVDAVVGPFSTVGLLAVDVSAPEPFDVRARRIQDQLLEDLAHRHFDGVNVQRELARQRGASEAAMPVVFTGLLDHDFQNSVSRLGEVVSAVNQTAQVWMDLHVDEQDGSFVFKLDTVEGLFPAGMAEAMLGAYGRLLECVAGGELQPAAEQLLPADQLERRRRVNATAAPAAPALAHAGFREQARRQPEHPAVVAGGRTLRYGELFERATRIGRRLREAGARPDQLVAVAMEKGWEQVAGVLGVLESGAAYLPVDPELPAERFQHLLAHGEVRIALTQERLAGALAWPAGLEILCVDRDEDWAGASTEPLEPAQRPEHLAYVLYTSGSTGLPKGAMIEHRSVANRMADVIRRFGMGPSDRVMAVTALHHDLSVFDLFAGLGAGATLVVPEAAQRRDPAHWAELVEREGITLWNSVPAFVEMLVEYLEHARRPQAAHSLRRVMLSGDWVPVSLPDRLRALSPRTEVTSLGGPTETTVWDIGFPIGAVDPGWKSIPYGQPLDAARYYVLDANLEPRPDWATGELYIAGEGLARGYWRDPDKTAEKFLQHPKTGERLYRSGDLGRYLPDGNLEFMGRADFQVKIQGQRIELGEIEAALRQHASVAAVVVSAVDDPAGRKALAAWLVCGAGAPADAELRDFLAAKLPRHMIPAAFVRLEKLPLTQNGKVDRRNLPDPFEGRDADAAEAAPAGELEARIGALVQEVLRLPALAPDASFIGQGANSIDLVRLGNRLEAELGERPRIDEMFRLDSVRALAGYYDKRRAGRSAPSGAGSAGLVDAEIAALVASYRVLLDPAERDAFKAGEPGIRRGDPGRVLALAGQPDEAAYRARGSWRRYSLHPVPFEVFSRWLGCLRRLRIDDNPKYLYGSAGGLYPNQAYLHVKPGRIEGVGAGTWYYHPIDHALVELEPGAELPRDIHIPFVNQPVFDEAAFSVFLVTQVAAIAPGYGEHAIRFGAIEAGLMSQLLETASLGTGIGLCSIGSVDFERVRPLFHLEPSHVLIHNLVGGWIGDGGAALAEAGSDAAARAARLAERIRDLSPEQVAALLRASRTEETGGTGS